MSGLGVLSLPKTSSGMVLDSGSGHAGGRWSMFPSSCFLSSPGFLSRTGDCLSIVVDRKLRHDDVLACLTDLFARHGPPDHIRSDNGAEFAATAVRVWLSRAAVKTLYIEPFSQGDPGSM